MISGLFFIEKLEENENDSDDSNMNIKKLAKTAKTSKQAYQILVHSSYVIHLPLSLRSYPLRQTSTTACPLFGAVQALMKFVAYIVLNY